MEVLRRATSAPGGDKPAENPHSLPFYLRGGDSLLRLCARPLLMNFPNVLTSIRPCPVGLLSNAFQPPMSASVLTSSCVTRSSLRTITKKS